MWTLSNQKQMQDNRLANIDLEEWEKPKQNPTILRAENSRFGNCQERTYWISRKASWMDPYFLLGFEGSTIDVINMTSSFKNGWI